MGANMGAGSSSASGRPSPFGLIAGPRSSTSAFLAISTGGNRSYASGHPFDRVADAPANLVHISDAFDLGHRHPGAPVVVEHGRGARVVLVHALHDRLACVVLPSFDLGAMQEAVDELQLWDVEGDHEVDLAAELRQHAVERLGLLGRPGEAVKKHALGRVGAAEAALDDAVDQIVGDEVAGGHDAPGLLADLAPVGHLGTQDLARRQVRHVELALDPRRLSTLATSWWAEDQSDH